MSISKRKSQLSDYAGLLRDIKTRIRSAQVRASFAVNSEMLQLYWDIGRMLVSRQAAEGWGTKVLQRLAIDLHNELPEQKGYSERNLKLMTQFYREYSGHQTIGQRPVAQISWAHNVLLMQKVKNQEKRLWYIQQTIEHGWSRDILRIMIENNAHARQGKAVTNFTKTLPPPQSDLAKQTLKDPYIFDFLTLEKSFHERELETGLLRHLQDFLVELGSGFAFVGRQVHLEVGKDDFYIDLLFYHLRLRCFVVIDLKVGQFKAEHAGKMNFYLNAVDDRMRHKNDAPSIGLILCQDKNRVVAEYALHNMHKAIGVSEYQLTRALPKGLKSALPSIEEIEVELSKPVKKSKNRK